MGRHELSLENVDEALHKRTVPLGPKAGKKLKPGKKDKKRGTLSFSYQYLSFGKLSTILLDKNTPILEIIATKTPHDGVASALIAMLQSDLPRLSNLMKLALTYEINNTLTHEQLFRTDSMCTKLMKASSKQLGSVWLYDALGPTVHAIAATNEYIEIDEAKATKPITVSENVAKLMQSCKEVLNAILNSFAHVPGPIQDLIHLIASIVHAKFPESTTQAVSGYVFLRFFGPGISSPAAFGLGVEPKIEAQRHLILIAKVILNIANDTAVREPFLQPMAHWIEEQQTNVNTKILQLAEGPPAPSPLPIPNQSVESLIGHYKELVLWLSKSFSVLERHGVSEPDYKQLMTEIDPYIRALAACNGETEVAKAAHCHISGLFKPKSKKL